MNMKKLLHAAEREASNLGHDIIDIPHIELAIVADNKMLYTLRYNLLVREMPLKEIAPMSVIIFEYSQRLKDLGILYYPPGLTLSDFLNSNHLNPIIKEYALLRYKEKIDHQEIEAWISSAPEVINKSDLQELVERSTHDCERDQW